MNTLTPQAQYNVVVTSAGFPPGYRAGGPVRSVTRIVDTAPRDINLTVITHDRDLGDRQPYPELSGRWTKRGHARVFYLNFRSLRHWLAVAASIRRDPLHLLYINSLMLPTLSILPVVAAKLRVIKPAKILIAPRGELSSGALGLKSAKKKIFLRVFDRLIRNMPIVWHASTEMEAAQIRSRFHDADIVVNSNQVSPPDKKLDLIAPRPGPKFVFIGRISPMKGLDKALEAVSELRSRASFDIFGPLEDDLYWSQCQKIIARMPEHVSVRYAGILAPNQVVTTFAEYDAFVFPTHGENFGHVIAESLQASCPVICSDKTPWTKCLQEGGGWVVGLQGETLPEILEKICLHSGAERAENRLRSREAFDRWFAASDSRNVIDIMRERHV